MTLATYEEVVDAEIVPDEITKQEARELTDRIRVDLESVWQSVVEAYTRGAHRALGYASWDSYCTSEFGSNRIRLPREERTETVRSLFEAGLSIKSIVSATGADRNTVRKDLRQGGEFHPPEKQLGQDGKTYTRPAPTVSERDWPVVPEPTPEELFQRLEKVRAQNIADGISNPPRTREEQEADAQEFVESLVGSRRSTPPEPEPAPERDSMTVALINDLRGPWRRGITSAAKKMTEKERQILIDAIETTLNELKEI